MVLLDKPCPPPLSIWACHGDRDPRTLRNLSVAALLARPDLFDAHVVKVEGVLSEGFEDNFLFLDPNSFERMLISNAIRLDLTAVTKAAKYGSGETVRVLGRFETGPTANLALATVGILFVHEIEVAPRRPARSSVQAPP